jgi:hypothetical protein
MNAGAPQLRSELLQRQGWTRRFTAFGHRLSEAAALYQQLGYDVRLEPAEVREADAATEGSGCESCFVMAQARTIYTRSRPVSRPDDRHPDPRTPEEVHE